MLARWTKTVSAAFWLAVLPLTSRGDVAHPVGSDHQPNVPAPPLNGPTTRLVIQPP